MSSQGKWKLAPILIIASAILGVVGWQQFTPKPTQPATITITPTTTTATGTQKTVAPVGTINYYLSLLESNGTEPYVQLAKELRKLPDLTNATAVAKITYLALNSSSPEVKEALELMMKGGTPDRRDYKYSVPDRNTELQILYWIASRRELKRDDTLALSIAMVNGIWVTIGEDAVREAVARDAAELLDFFRETNELQETKGYFPLERYPLEAKLCLSWTGGDPARGGRIRYQLMSGGPRSSKALNIHHFMEFEHRPASLNDYKWNAVSIATLRLMQATVAERNWIDKSTDATVRNIEEYFYFQKDRHWIFTQPNDAMISFGDEQTVNHNMNNPNLVFEHYLKTGKGLGVCGDEASLAECLCKSWGISTIRLTRTYGTEDGRNHDHIVYYEPVTKTWKCYEKHLAIGRSGTWNVYLFRPQAVQRNYFVYRPDSQQTWMKMPNLYYTISYSPGEQTADSFLKGILTAQMKQWLLYS